MWDKAEEGANLWRKFLFDMDARKYKYKPFEQPGHSQMVQLVPGYDEKVQELTTLSEDDLFPQISTAWAMKVFEQEEVANNTYAAWQEGYLYIQRGKGNFQHMTSPGAMATIGLRDFSDQLTPTEAQWCQEELLRYGEKVLKQKDSMDFGSLAMDEEQAIFGLSLIFNANSSDELVAKAKEIIFRVLISNSREQIKKYLVAGIRLHLAKGQPQYLISCWYGILACIDKKREEKVKQDQENVYGFHHDSNEPDLGTNQETEANWREELIRSVVQGTISPPQTIEPTLLMETHWLLNDALSVIPYDTALQQQHNFIKHLLQQHLNYVNNPLQRHKHDFHDSRHAFTYFYPRFLLAQPQDIAAKYFIALLLHTLHEEEKPKTKKFIIFVYDLIKGHISAVNNNGKTDNFWALWDLLRKWMILKNSAYLMPLFLMDIDWDDSAEKWHILNGKNLYYKDFIVKYGVVNINKTLKFLSGVAFHNFMPNSISWLTTMFTSKKANDLSLEMAERFIQKAFYNYGATIKGNKVLLNDFISILDFLIGRHSTKAYMLKEELIQYKLVP